MIHEGVSRCAIVFFESESVMISFVCHLKCIVLSVCDVLLKVLQVNSQHDIINIRQTVKIVVSEPELAAQTSEPFFVSFPVTMEVNRAVQTSLENGPASTVRGHVTQHSYWFTAIWIDCVHAIGSETIFKWLGVAFCFRFYKKKK